MMLTRGTAPPPGVKLSWAELTAPVEVPVVDAANSPEPEGPKRTSLPSALPPAWSSFTTWDTSLASSSGLPSTSKAMAIPALASQRASMAARTAIP